jgi:hypothetical protein
MNKRVAGELAMIAKRQRRLSAMMDAEGVSRRMALAWWRLERRAQVLAMVLQ